VPTAPTRRPVRSVPYDPLCVSVERADAVFQRAAPPPRGVGRLCRDLAVPTEVTLAPSRVRAEETGRLREQPRPRQPKLQHRARHEMPLLHRRHLQTPSSIFSVSLPLPAQAWQRRRTRGDTAARNVLCPTAQAHVSVTNDRDCSTEHGSAASTTPRLQHRARPCCIVAACQTHGRRRHPSLASPSLPRPKLGRGGGRAATPPHATCCARWHKHTYPSPTTGTSAQSTVLLHRCRCCCQPHGANNQRNSSSSFPCSRDDSETHFHPTTEYLHLV